MSRLDKDTSLKGFIDFHLHTSPDVKPRLLTDIEAAGRAKLENMAGIVIKSHEEPTSGRAQVASQVADFPVYGGVCLNNSVGGINPTAVETTALMGGKIVWFPTTSRNEINISKLDSTTLENILNIIFKNEMVLATGHLKTDDIFHLLDISSSMGLKKVVVNHPLTKVVGASLEEQKEMSKKAYMEHCYVASLPHHDGLDPAKIAEAIKYVDADRCMMATDLGQPHNTEPVNGFKSFINLMLYYGISGNDIRQMCHINPCKLLL